MARLLLKNICCITQIRCEPKGDRFFIVLRKNKKSKKGQMNE